MVCFISWQEVYSIIGAVSRAELIKQKIGPDSIMQESIETQEMSYSCDYEEFYLQRYAALCSGEIQRTTRPLKRQICKESV